MATVIQRHKADDEQGMVMEERSVTYRQLSGLGLARSSLGLYLDAKVGTRAKGVGFTDVFERRTFKTRLAQCDGTVECFASMGTSQAHVRYTSGNGTINQKVIGGPTATAFDQLAPDGSGDTVYLTAHGLDPIDALRTGDRLIGMTITVTDGRADKLKHGIITGGIFGAPTKTYIPDMTNFLGASNASGVVFGIPDSGTSAYAIPRAQTHGLVPVVEAPLPGTSETSISYFHPHPENTHFLTYYAPNATNWLENIPHGAPVLSVSIAGTSDGGTPTTEGIQVAVTYYSLRAETAVDPLIAPAHGNFHITDLNDLEPPLGMHIIGI